MTRSSLLRASAGAAAFSFVLASAVSAQGTPAQGAAQSPSYAIGVSGRATTSVELTQRVAPNTPAAQRPAPRRITIDYGQPHARGRDVTPLIAPSGTPWRAGANTSTSFVTEVDLVVGGKPVPKGSYTLYVQRSGNGAELIVNRQTGQWGTVYDAKQDLVRVPMRVRTLAQPLEALQIALVPTPSTLAGVLRMTWGTHEMEVDWEAKP